MAKTTESSSTDTGKTSRTVRKSVPKAAASKSAAKGKSASAASKAPKTAAIPLFDTNLVAQTAAAMLAHHDIAEQVAEQNAAAPRQQQESSTFKQLKEQLAHPKPAGLSHLLGTNGGQKKSGGGPNSFNQQKGHNQTFGGFNKAGVPRRTNG